MSALHLDFLSDSFTIGDLRHRSFYFNAECSRKSAHNRIKVKSAQGAEYHFVCGRIELVIYSKIFFHKSCHCGGYLAFIALLFSSYCHFVAWLREGHRCKLNNSRGVTDSIVGVHVHLHCNNDISTACFGNVYLLFALKRNKLSDLFGASCGSVHNLLVRCKLS